jgi:cytochrome c553
LLLLGSPFDDHSEKLVTISLPAAPEGGNRTNPAGLVGRMVRVAVVLAMLVAVSACAGNGQPGAAAKEGPPTPDQVEDTMHVCSTCHGFGGRSISPTFPRLAGQQNDYLVAQLNAFRDRTRADPNARTYMWGMAAHLSDPMIAAISAYYARQSPVSGTTQDATDVGAGRKIYEQGVPDKVLPCMACHGAEAEGAGVTPRLAGQHRLSLERQLAYFATNKRTGSLMPEESVNLTDRQITEVSAYLAARSAGKPGTAAQGGPVTQDRVEDTARVCSSCHEFGGANVSPIFTFPRLAGQQKDYLVAQLKTFRDKTRADPRARAYMWDRAAHLSDAMILALAGYYSAKPPVAGKPGTSPEIAAGAKIFAEGIPSENAPACMACHGAKAEGNGPIPRLAGQRRAYLAGQLQAFESNARANPIMHQETKSLTLEQIREVTAFLATQ